MRLNSILKPTNFNFLPCSGASVPHILSKQVKSKAFGTPDLVTMTAGGMLISPPLKYFSLTGLAR